MNQFVFRITEVCNKRCPTCCVGTTCAPLKPEAFRKKLVSIGEFSRQTGGNPRVYLTGGEPFFYRAKDEGGRLYNILDLVDLVREVIPEADLVIKTSGWTSHRKLDTLLEDVQVRGGKDKVDVRLGFNLYQTGGGDPLDRLRHMVASISRYQSVLRIETIYDRENIADTFLIIERALFEEESHEKASFERMLTDIALPHRFVIETDGSYHGSQDGDRTMILDTMPAYPGMAGDGADRFIEAKVDRICPRIQSGPNQIMYNPDLSFFHCNDAFADHSVRAFPPICENSVDEEFRVLKIAFGRLRQFATEKHLKFEKRREQCVFCTQYVLSQADTCQVLQRGSQ